MNTVAKILKLSKELREKGYSKHADELEYKYLILKKSETNLYSVFKETGESLVNDAHPEGSVKMHDAKDDNGVVETVVDQKAKIEKIVAKQPTGKLANKHMVNLINKLAGDFPDLFPRAVESSAAEKWISAQLSKLSKTLLLKETPQVIKKTLSTLLHNPKITIIGATAAWWIIESVWEEHKAQELAETLGATRGLTDNLAALKTELLKLQIITVKHGDITYNVGTEIDNIIMTLNQISGGKVKRTKDIKSALQQINNYRVFISELRNDLGGLVKQLVKFKPNSEAQLNAVALLDTLIPKIDIEFNKLTSRLSSLDQIGDVIEDLSAEVSYQVKPGENQDKKIIDAFKALYESKTDKVGPDPTKGERVKAIYDWAAKQSTDVALDNASKEHITDASNYLKDLK